MRLSNELPPSTQTAEAPPSPSPNSARNEAGSGQHELVVAIFFIFGILAVAAAVIFTQRSILNTNLALKAGRYPHVTLLDRALTSPSTFFAPAMILAGLAVWRLRLIPQGFHTCWVRVLSGGILAFFLYPVGLIALVLVIFGGMWLHIGENWPPPNSPDWVYLVVVFPLAALLCGAGMLTVAVAALGLAVATRWWPRRMLLWSFVTSAGVLFCSFTFGLLRQKILFPTIPLWNDLVNHASDFLALSMIWNVEAPIVIGEPILAALFGHWFYLAAKEWSAKPA